jgi:hypothetical protein
MWHVSIRQSGRGGEIVYTEGVHEIVLWWEFGGGDVLAIVTGPPPHTWDSEFPWTRGRRREILSRIAESVIQQKAPGRRAEFTFGDTGIVFR